MTIGRTVAGLAYYPLRYWRAARRTKRPRLRVLSYHDFAPGEYALLSQQLHFIRRHWDIVDATTFAELIDGRRPLERDTVLLTFDDGTISNKWVANRVLEPLGIRALFFVVSDYALLDERSDWRDFVSKRILRRQPRPDLSEQFRNMTIQDLDYLRRQGHTIGAHTATHACLADLSRKEQEREILDGGDRLEHALSTTIDHFAYPFGTFQSLTAHSSAVARSRFKYVYTGLRGDNAVTQSPWCILRESNDPHDSLWYTGACLEGVADSLYRRRHQVLRSW